MPARLTVGDEAPDFDLASTEGVVLMLKDEVPRSQVLLYFFPAEATAEVDLVELAGLAPELAARQIKVFAISEKPLDDLIALQRQHRLPFPLLHDDRSFSDLYGSGETPSRVVVLVDREQRIAWMEQEPSNLAASVAEARKAAEGAASSTANYPRSVINRLVDRWVN